MGQDVTPYPLCTQIVNETDYTVRGSVSTDTATYEGSDDETLNGTQARHMANFRIEPQGAWDICSQGPFFEGKRVELTLRTLIPVFACRTALTDTIYIRDTRTEDGEYQVFATCH